MEAQDLSVPPAEEKKFAETKYQVGQLVKWCMGPSLITEIELDGEKRYYKLKHIQFPLGYRVSEEVLESFQATKPEALYQIRSPHLIVVDNFYQDPKAIREIAMEQTYHANAKAYKGKRTTTRLLLPGLKERFEKLIGASVTNWLTYETNGIFQITKYTDPLVWHSDHQSHAAAIYLTPNAPVTAGTSFWRDRKYGCRRPPFHEQEWKRFEDDPQRQSAQDEIYSQYNLLHPDNWELVDRVGSLYNRLVIWDGQMIHSASSYESFVGASDIGDSRLVQLFFFDIAN